MINPVLAVRGQIGGVLATGAGGALPWWNPDGATPAATCGAWQAKGAASLAASYLNLATLGNANIDPAVVGGVAPTFDPALGWITNGINQYLKTGVLPAGSFTTIIRFSNGPGNTSYLDCLYGAAQSGTQRIEVWTNALNRLRIANQLETNYPAITSGVIAVAGNCAYLDTALLSCGLGGAWTAIARDIYIGARNTGSPTEPWPGYIQAFAVYNLTLTAAQVLARRTAIAAL